MPLGLAILSCALAAGTCHGAADPDVRAYAVRVSGAPGTLVRLSALDIPHGWTASFCTPRVCSPRRVAFALRAGSGTIQVSYVRGGPGAPLLRVLHVAARAGDVRADARQSVVP